MSVFAFSSNNAKEHLLGWCADGLVVSVQGMEAELDVGDQGSNPPSAAEFISVENFFQKKVLFLKIFFFSLFHLLSQVRLSSIFTFQSGLHLRYRPRYVSQSMFLICFIAPGMLAS